MTKKQLQIDKEQLQETQNDHKEKQMTKTRDRAVIGENTYQICVLLHMTELRFSLVFAWTEEIMN